MSQAFEVAYPNLTRWVDAYGWLEIGADEYSPSLIRILDPGGMVWESEEDYSSLDEALQAADSAIADWLEEQGLD
ncbi:MAG: hypothetical protein HS126_23480 [Anaerolineales bacterium]|nr:hypothetical protein [Anaerolineales bacterium]